MSREAVPVRFSRHAKNEMRLYKIAAADVESVVAAPNSTGRDGKGNARLGDRTPMAVR